MKTEMINPIIVYKIFIIYKISIIYKVSILCSKYEDTE